MKIKGLTLLLCILLAGTSLLKAQVVKEHGQLSVDGLQLVDAKGEAIVLRGMSLGWHQFWPRFYNAGAVQWLHTDWGCSVVRAAMGIELEGGYLDKPEWSQQLIETVVDAAIATDIYVIIDWHSHGTRQPEAIAFFDAMSKKYADKPNVIYEIYNEPDYETWAEVKEYSTAVINTIRANDPDNVILVGSPHWDQDIDTVANDPLVGFDNIMYTLHFYAATHKKELRKRADYALSKGIPIFVSEYGGTEASGDGKVDYKEWDKWIEWAEKNKISWVAWSVSDKDESCSVLDPANKSEGGWPEELLRPTGKYARKLIRQYNDVE